MMQRRKLITLLGGAAAASLARLRPLHAQRQPPVPTIGMLFFGTSERVGGFLPAFREGLVEGGYVERRNVAIEYRWAENHADRLPKLANELVQRRVAVIVAPDNPAAARVAKAATTAIPIVFGSAGDPVLGGLVASLNRPGGNVTGINDMSLELEGKRLGILHELMPPDARFAVLINSGGTLVEGLGPQVKAAAAATGRQIEIFGASANGEIETAIASLVQQRFGALAVTAGLRFNERLVPIVTLATRHLLPIIGPHRQWPEAGALMGYGPVSAERYRQIGVYTARVLKGEKPADLPVMRPTKFELVINMATARALGVTVPATLLATADEVIE